jgi:FkbM family methyltransferase
MTIVRAGLHAICPSPLRRWREMRYFLRHGETELRLVPLLCRRDRDSIDVGANEGAYLHQMIPHSRRVFAFEPIPALAAALRCKFGRRVAVRGIALSRSTGSAVLRIPAPEGGGGVTGLASLVPAASRAVGRCDELDVKTAALDEVYVGDAGFLKIDVEGHEEAVLDGAAEAIARCRPRILVEMEERFAPGVIERGRQRFHRAGYRGIFVHEGKLWPIESFDARRLQREDVVAGYVGRSPRAQLRYVNNFIFLPEEDCTVLLPRIAHAIASEH